MTRIEVVGLYRGYAVYINDVQQDGRWRTREEAEYIADLHRSIDDKREEIRHLMAVINECVDAEAKAD